jgi:hypothetical protein
VVFGNCAAASVITSLLYYLYTAAALLLHLLTSADAVSLVIHACIHALQFAKGTIMELLSAPKAEHMVAKLFREPTMQNTVRYV